MRNAATGETVWPEEWSLFTIVTSGYVDLTLNLAASLRKLGLHTRLTVYALDASSADRVRLAGLSVIRWGGRDALSEWSDYKTPGFAEVTAAKYEIALQLMAQSRTAFFCDGDIVWLRSPLAHLLAQVREGVDILMQLEPAQSDRPPAFNTGFWLARPTPRSTALISECLDVLRGRKFMCDQSCFNDARSRHAGASVAPLEPTLYPCGLLFGASLPLATQLSAIPGAYILHFNFNRGKESKLRDMRRVGATSNPSIASNALTRTVAAATSAFPADLAMSINRSTQRWTSGLGRTRVARLLRGHEQ